MKKLIKTSFSIFAAFAIVFTFSLQQVNAAEKIRWKVQSTFNTGWPALGDPVARLSDTLDRATDGRIKLKVYEPGKILPPLEISPSISKGDLPAAYNYMAYDQGRIPAAVLFAAVPFGMEPWEYAAWWFEGEGSKLANEIYNKQNIQVLLCSTIGPETAGWYRNPITSLDDLKGLKFRAYNSSLIRLAELTGMAPTKIEAAEISQAFSTGAVESMITSPTTGKNSKIWENGVKYFYDIAAWYPKNMIIVNKDAWSKLDSATQKLVMSEAAIAEKKGWALSKKGNTADKKALADAGMTVGKVNSALNNHFKEVGSTMSKEWASRAGSRGQSISFIIF